MQMYLDRIEVLGEHAGSAPFIGAPFTGTTTTVGPLVVTHEESDREGRSRWSVANRGDRPLSLGAVRQIWRLTGGETGVERPLRMFRNGYQSWSPTGVATLGVDVDPSTVGPSAGRRVPRLVRATHHADEAIAEPGELRSEAVTVLRAGNDRPVLVGFVGGSTHDGTLRLRDTDAGPELAVEAFLGGAVLAAGAERVLHDVFVDAGASADDPHAVAGVLERWAAIVGRAERARTAAPFQVGWCSWYHYFGDVTEADLRSNLARADDWPFDLFQLDDGYQTAIGDWLGTNDTFASPLDELAGTIAAAGRRPGLWLAPFLAAPGSQVAREHPGWVARYVDGERPLVGMWHPVWGGAVHTLDTSNPEVLAHLTSVTAEVVAAGFTYLKLDFTYAPAAEGVYADGSRTPAERVRAGYDAVRAGAGDGAFILGCGAPLGAVVGVVDGMRIGPDVAPHWNPEHANPALAGYEGGEPATVNAWRCTLARSFMHRHLWLNDPDCLMLRTRRTRLTADKVRAWSLAVGVSGGMALVSDDLALLDGDARRLLDEVIELGRRSDAAAGDGAPARCGDLLDHAVPHRLAAAGVELRADPSDGVATLTPN